MAITFDTLIPNLIVDDVARSLAFYRDRLGFEIVATVPAQEPFVFVWLRRDATQVYLNDAATARAHEAHAAHVDLTPGKSGISLYIKLAGIHTLHADLAPHVPVVAPLERKFYGLTEFGITDPDGYLITFAEQID